MRDYIYCNVSEQMLSIEEATNFVHAPENGALNMFIGRVRNYNNGKTVAAVSYDVFIPLARNILQQLCIESITKFSSQLRVYIQHYKGKLEIGGISVIIAASAPHRDETFKACRYLIEQLKTRAPIWKQEHYIDGSSEWMLGHTLCKHHNE